MLKFTRLASISMAAVGTLALSACGGGGGDTIEAENESVEAVAETVAKSGAADDAKPAPGRYEAEFKIVKMDMPGMPADMAAIVKKRIGSVETSFSCLTEEEAAKAEENFFKPPKARGEECKFNKFKMGGGKIEADMTCEQEGNSQNMQMSGTYNAEGHTMNLKTEANMGPQKMQMEAQITSKRVGDCDGSEMG